jgi:hypothetical protein
MPIDASIPLMGKPIEIENPVNALAKIQQLNTLSRQNALADMQLQNMQQTMADQRQLRQVATDAFDPASGKLDNKKLRSGLASMGAYQQLQELDNAELNRLEKQGKIDKSTVENAQLKLSLLGQTAGALRASGASRDQVVEAVGSLARDGVIPSEEAVQMISRIPSDPAALNQWLHQAQLWALDAKSQLPTYTTTDVGGQVLVREQVPGKAPTTVGSLKKSPTPGEQMSNQRGWADLKLKQENVGINRDRLALEREKEAARAGSAQSRARDAQALSGLIDDAEALIKQSTGSYTGNVIDTAAQTVGYGTKGANAIAKLKVIESNLILKMPKMSGPQSDRDVQLYRQAAAQIGDPTVPRSTRTSALQTLRDINEKYKTSNFMSDMSPDTSPNTLSGLGGEVDWGSLK